MARRILIIEDDPDNAALVMRQLRTKAGMTAAVSMTFHDGLALARAEKFDCAIVDLGLPDTSSSEDTIRLCNDFPCPIVFLTGNGDADILRQARETGASVVIKPGGDLLIEKVWSQINFRGGDSESELGQQEAQRRIQSPTKSWLENKAAVIGICVTLAGAAVTMGASLYRAISSEARQTEQTAQTLAQYEKRIAESEKRHADHELKIGIIQQQNQISIDDRSAMHSQIGTIKDGQTELKMDVIRRLERIEDKLDRRTSEKAGN